MKTNILTFIFLSFVFIGVPVFAEDMPVYESPNNDPVWYFNNPAGADSPMFGPAPALSPEQMVPVGSQNTTAAGGDAPTLSVAGLKDWFLKLLGYAVEVILGLALISFLYGIFRLVFLDASNEEGRNKARKFMLWGIISLFVMVSVWGLVNILKSSVFGSGAGLTLPGFK